MNSRKINVNRNLGWIYFSSLQELFKTWQCKTVLLCIKYYGRKCKVISKYKRLWICKERMYLKERKWNSWLGRKGNFLTSPWNLAAFLKQSLKLWDELKIVRFTFFGTLLHINYFPHVKPVRNFICRDFENFTGWSKCK